MQIKAESYGHAVIFNLKGDLTEDALQAFRLEMDRQITEGTVLDIVLNLEQVPFIDSAGLEYLLDLGDKLAQNMARLRLAKPDENVRKILEIARLDSAFEVFDDIPQAIGSERS